MRQPESPAYPAGVDLHEALEIVAARAGRCGLPAEAVALPGACGRVLALDVRAACEVPAIATSAMDGFALRGADLPGAGAERTFALAGAVAAGAAAVPRVAQGQCARVATGAPMPFGADTVVVQEHVRAGPGRIVVSAGERPGGNVRVPGEEFARGQLVLRAGEVVRARDVAALAALGTSAVSVRRAPRIALIGVGDELVSVEGPLGFGQVHAANVAMLAAMAGESGFNVVSQRLVGDDRGRLAAALQDAAARADVVVTSGGLSAGAAECLPEVLAQVGEVGFHKVRCKPCIPLLFGQVGSALCFSLPGTRAGSAVGFRVFTAYAARVMLGRSANPAPGWARLDAPLARHRARAELVGCGLHVDAAGVQWASVPGQRQRAAAPGAAHPEALALLPETRRDFARGDLIRLWD